MKKQLAIIAAFATVVWLLTGCANFRPSISYTGEHGETFTVASDGKTVALSGGINGFGGSVALPLPKRKGFSK